MKQADLKAIDVAYAKGGLISFDLDVRLPLWENAEDCRKKDWNLFGKHML